MNQRIQIGARLPIAAPSPEPARPSTPPPGGPSFQQVLQGVLTERPVRLSSHAQERLSAANRHLSEQEWQAIAKAVDKVAQKGAREALLLTQDLALVVSVTNRTVITAVERERAKENVFTNIDAAVIL
ncbi:MAG TPA: TIGR02530 family flagellar biosynthesis protein [Symbiobacteriaceae bacterium]|nr:TIGR02530 family flagellar biosynthesis protein [Symbiobacteriaceae bacterium]